MEQPPHAPRAPRGSPHGPRRPDFLAPDDENDDPFGASSARRAAIPPRNNSLPSAAAASRPEARSPRHGHPRLSLPSMPHLPSARRRELDDDTWREHPDRQEHQAADGLSSYGMPTPYAGDSSITSWPASRGGRGRSRARTSARPLSPMRRRQVAGALDALSHPPDPLVATTMAGMAPALPARALGNRFSMPVALARPRVARRVRTQTQRLARAARSPWTAARFLLALAAITLALLTAAGHMGEPVQPLMLHTRWSASGGAQSAASIASQVRPETQIVQYQLYDTYQQFLDWQDAACSAATTSEVLTAWGVKNATIGQVIDRMGPDISLNGGLINEYGFQRAAAAYGYRADISHSLTYKQMLYITNQLGLPIIVNVRISYGYYHYFDTGHFLVMTGGDDQGVAIVDSSTYYIHYLPLSVFFSMFTGRTYVIVPKDYSYNVPAI